MKNIKTIIIYTLLAVLCAVSLAEFLAHSPTADGKSEKSSGNTVLSAGKQSPDVATKSPDKKLYSEPVVGVSVHVVGDHGCVDCDPGGLEGGRVR